MYQLIFILIICEIVNSNAESRIVGGSDTTIEQYPYQVSLQKKFNSSYDHICGGTIVKENIIITSAHCFIEKQSENETEINDTAKIYKIKYGVTELSTKGNEAPVRSIHIHEKYEPKTHRYDVAIVKLVANLKFNDKVQSIPIGTKRPPAGSKAVITGWGYTSEGGSVSNTLQAAEVPVISLAECQQKYESEHEIYEDMICAGLPEGGVDACQGDSGGPLVVDGKLYGSTSFGVGCARSEFPGVYAFLPSASSFISSNS